MSGDEESTVVRDGGADIGRIGRNGEPPSPVGVRVGLGIDFAVRGGGRCDSFACYVSVTGGWPDDLIGGRAAVQDWREGGE